MTSAPSLASAPVLLGRSCSAVPASRLPPLQLCPSSGLIAAQQPLWTSACPLGLVFVLCFGSGEAPGRREPGGERADEWNQGEPGADWKSKTLGSSFNLIPQSPCVIVEHPTPTPSSASAYSYFALSCNSLGDLVSGPALSLRQIGGRERRREDGSQEGRAGQGREGGADGLTAREDPPKIGNQKLRELGCQGNRRRKQLGASWDSCG